MTSPFVNTANKSSGVSTSGSVTISHTISGNGNRLIMASCGALRSVNPPTGLSATYNGTSMTQIGSLVTVNLTVIGLFYLLEASIPAAGAYDLVFTQSGGNGSGFRMAGGGLEFYSVDQTTPLGTSNSAIADSASPSVNITAAVDDIVYNILGQNLDGNTVTPGEGQTLHFDRHPGGGLQATTTYQTAAGTTVTPSYTLASSTLWGIIGVAVKGVAAAASPSGNFFLFM